MGAVQRSQLNRATLYLGIVADPAGRRDALVDLGALILAQATKNLEGDSIIPPFCSNHPPIAGGRRCRSATPRQHSKEPVENRTGDAPQPRYAAAFIAGGDMITCSRPECQTAAGCKCGRSWDYPVRLPMRKTLSEYTDAELRNELQRRATLARTDQSFAVCISAPSVA
jgi:hypothetical protein